LFHLVVETWKRLNEGSLYIVDSFLTAVCDNYRIIHCRIHQGEAWRGYRASNRRYFYGLKVHLLITKAGQPGALLDVFLPQTERNNREFAGTVVVETIQAVTPALS
jgi:hypothetical protein